MIRVQFHLYRCGHAYGKDWESRNKKCIIPCAWTWVQQQIRIWKLYFHRTMQWSMPYCTGERMAVSLLCVTYCAFSRHSFLQVEKHVWSSHTLDHQYHEGRNRAVLMITALFSSHKQTSNNGFKWTSAMNDAGGKKGGKCTALWMHKCNQKCTQFHMPWRFNLVHTQSFCRTT